MRPSFLATLLLLCSPYPYAQQDTDTSFETIEELSDRADQANRERDIEKVEVTGSYIRRIDREGPAPISKIERDDFFETGSIDFMDVLREDPAFENVRSSDGAARLRGQSQGSLLVLLNGMRLPKRNGGFFTSVRSLPASIMESTEILKDGGSALYGSDAMSGVINYKTRKDFDGAEVSVVTRTSEEGLGTQQSYSAVYGKTFRKGNVMGVIQYERSDAFLEQDLGSFRNSSEVAVNSNTQASFGRINIGETYIDDGRERLSSFNDLPFRQASPEDNDLSALLTASYDFNNSIKASLLGTYNRKTRRTRGAPWELRWRNSSGDGGFDRVVSRSDITNPDFLNYLDAQNAFGGRDTMSVVGTFADEIGARVNEEVEDSINVQAQVEGYLGDTWTWQVMAGASTLDVESTTLSGEVDQAVVRDLFNSGNMNFANGPVDLSPAFITPTSRSFGEMYQAKVVATGELANFSNGGILSAAFGAEQQYETFRFDNDEAIAQGRTLGRRQENNSGSRRVDSAFMELAYAPISEVELNLSGRVDSYSDVGDTINPRFTFLVTPSRKVMVRGSVGTGFRAPGLTDLNGGEQDGISFVRDQGCPQAAAGGRACSGNYSVTRFNSDELKPEEGLNYGLGTVIQATKTLSLSIDQWNFEGTDSLSAISPQAYTEYERDFGTEAARAAGAIIERDSEGNLVSITAPRVSNLGERTLRGVDATLNLDTNFNNALPFNVGFSNGFSYIFERTQRRFALEGLEVLNDSWKLNNRIFIRNDSHNLSLRALTVSSDDDNRGLKLPQHTSLDLSYAYNTSWNGRFNIVIKNLVDRQVPVDPTQDIVFFGRNNRAFSSFSPLGRRFFGSYTQTF